MVSPIQHNTVSVQTICLNDIKYLNVKFLVPI